MSNWNSSLQGVCFTNILSLQNDLIKLESQTLRNERIFTHSLEFLHLESFGPATLGLCLCPEWAWVAAASLTGVGLRRTGFPVGPGAITLGLYLASVPFCPQRPRLSRKQTPR